VDSEFHSRKNVSTFIDQPTRHRTVVSGRTQAAQTLSALFATRLGP
jgi:hypothetical protein